MTNEAKREIFIEAAHNYYCKNTEKTFEQMQKEGYNKANWADGVDFDTFEDEDDVVMCAEEMATQAIEREAEEKGNEEE